LKSQCNLLKQASNQPKEIQSREKTNKKWKVKKQSKENLTIITSLPNYNFHIPIKKILWESA
jgi:hypothetical protein